ncbi:MAG: hypothetical protein AB4290_09520 [Spirulina sp.]
MSFVKTLCQAGKFFLSGILIFILSWGLAGCGDRIESKVEQPKMGMGMELETLAEAAPPEAIVQLDRSLARYQPQVTIVSPAAEEIIEETNISVFLRVDDLPVYRDRDLGLGPHLAVILDNEPTQEVYDLDRPLVLEDVKPGTHTLRVFAVKPWGESFKNEGAYAQTTFSLFTATPQNSPSSSEPVLTYNSPQGDYGTEPILLDFHIANAPLHLAARESTNDEIADWRIRVTANGKSFLLDRWTPIYLKGFKPGINWVKLEFLNEYGNPVENAFNTSVRLFNYQPNGQDTLSQLIRGELAALDASGIVDPNYKPAEITPIIEEEEPEEIPSPDEIVPEISEPEPSEELTPEEEIAPEPSEELTPEEIIAPEPSEELTSEEEIAPEPSEELLPEEEIAPEPSEQLMPEEESATEPSEQLLPEEESAPEPSEQLLPEETITKEEEIIEEEIPALEVEEEAISVEDNVEETELPVTETESLETENVAPNPETSIGLPSEVNGESTETEGIEEIESKTGEEEAIAPPENSEVSESDRSFFRGLLNQFMGSKTQASPNAIEEITEEQTPVEETQ